MSRLVPVVTGKTANALSLTTIGAANAAAFVVFGTMSAWFKNNMSANAADIAVKVGLGLLGVALVQQFANTAVSARRGDFDTKVKKAEAGVGTVSNVAFAGAVTLAMLHAARGHNLLTLNQEQETWFLSSLVAGLGSLIMKQALEVSRPDANRSFASLVMATALVSLGFVGVNLYDTENPGFAYQAPGWMKHMIGSLGTAAALGFATMAFKGMVDLYQARTAQAAPNGGDLGAQLLDITADPELGEGVGDDLTKRPGFSVTMGE